MRRRRERSSRSADRAQAVSSQQQPRDRVAPCIEDIDEPPAGGDTGRVVPAGGGGAEQAKVPSSSTAKAEIELDPALTVTSRLLSWVSTIAPCEPNPAPVPLPPVGKDPSEVKPPSRSARKASTELPPVALLVV